MTNVLSQQAAIVGIGATKFSRDSGCTELSLAVQAISAALDDADLTPKDVDGLCTFTSDNNAEYEVFRNIGGKDLKFWARAHPGGGAACTPLQIAKMAVLSGEADVMVCYRAMNEYSQYRFGKGYGSAQWSEPFPTADATLKSMHTVHGLRTAAAMLGISMRRYMHETGATSEDFAHVSVAARRHASTNPNAHFYGKPITVEDHQRSKLIADPFRLFDCCLESDGGIAIVVTRSDRAQSLRQTPVRIRAAAQGSRDAQVAMVNYYNADISMFGESALVAEQLYAQAELTPKGIQAAMIYDHFGPTVLPQLEAYGFCQRGEAKEFVRNGNIEIGGTLPINTHGGQLGEAYMHGLNGITEAVRQIRGNAVNQLDSVDNILVTGAAGTTTSGVILSKY